MNSWKRSSNGLAGEVLGIGLGGRQLRAWFGFCGLFLSQGNCFELCSGFPFIAEIPNRGASDSRSHPVHIIEVANAKNAFGDRVLPAPADLSVLSLQACILNVDGLICTYKSVHLSTISTLSQNRLERVLNFDFV